MSDYTNCPEYINSLADLLGIAGLRPDSIKIEGVALDGLNLSATARFGVPLDVQTELLDDRQHCKAWPVIEGLRRKKIEDAVDDSGLSTSEVIALLNVDGNRDPLVG